jgi:cell wall-associated NlpC family hydrolase
MVDACAHIPKAQARPGDLVVFGPGTGEHVVIIVGTGNDPDVVSHGQEAGPCALGLSTEAACHNKPITFLSATERRRDFAPPPTDRLDGLTNPRLRKALTTARRWAAVVLF